jgi:hypothetical protein
MRNENFGKGLVADLRKWNSLRLGSGCRVCLNGLAQPAFEHLTNLRNKLCKAGSFFG